MPCESEIAEPPDLLLHLSQQRRRDLPQPPAESAIVDRSALIDHHLAFASVSGRARRETDPQQTFAREPGRTGNDPGGWMSRPVQEIRLQDDHRTKLPGLRPAPRTQVGHEECSVIDPEGQSRPSPDERSSSAISLRVAVRTALDARR